MKLGTLEIGGMLNGGYTVTLNDLDSEDSVRNALGEMMRDRIAVKRKIELNFGPLTKAQMKSLMQAVEPIFFSVTYMDPLTGADRTCQMYVGDRTMPAWSETKGQWLGAKFNVIER